MALNPKTARALSQMIDSIVRECGGDPHYKDLIDTLQTAHKELGGSSESDAPAAARDGEKDDYSFETAQQRHKAATSASIDAAASAGTDGAEGGEGK